MIEETIELDEKSLKEVKEPTQRVSAERLEKFAELVEQKVKEAESDAEQEKNKEIKKEKKAAYRLKRKIYKKLKEDYSPRLKKYEAQMETFGDRNSYSKTDHDATFMRMKEDHMKNGRLKPDYNVQIGTEYTIHQRLTDTRCFTPHLEKLKTSGLPKPKRMIADAGYGGEANYLYAHEEALIPYNTMRKEETRAYKKYTECRQLGIP